MIKEYKYFGQCPVCPSLNMKNVPYDWLPDHCCECKPNKIDNALDVTLPTNTRTEIKCVLCFVSEKIEFEYKRSARVGCKRVERDRLGVGNYGTYHHTTCPRQKDCLAKGKIKLEGIVIVGKSRPLLGTVWYGSRVKRKIAAVSRDRIGVPFLPFSNNTGSVFGVQLSATAGYAVIYTNKPP